MDVLTIALLIQPLTYALGKATEDEPNVSTPASHVGISGETLDSKLWPEPPWPLHPSEE